MNDRVYRAVIGLARGVHRLFGFRFDIRGIENIPATGAAVLAVNHIGYLDFTFAGLAAWHRHRYVRFLAKRSAFTNPVSGPVMRAMGHVPVDRGSGSEAFRHALALLRAGELVGIFPEATISRSWTLKPFKPGAAAMAVQCQAPLIPVIAWGGHRVLTVDRHWHLRRGVAVTIVLGPPIEPPPRKAGLGAMAALNDELHATMARMLADVQRSYPQRPRDLRDRWWLPAYLGGTAPTPAAAAALDAAALRGGDGDAVPVSARAG